MYPCICFCILYSTVYTYIIYIYIYGYTRLHTHTRRFINRRYQCLIMSLKVYVVLLVSCCSYFFQLYYRRPPLSVAALGLGRAGLLLPSLTVLCCCRSRGCCFTLLSIVYLLAQVLLFITDSVKSWLSAVRLKGLICLVSLFQLLEEKGGPE
jgi:hypothetical protein